MDISEQTSRQLEGQTVAGNGQYKAPVPPHVSRITGLLLASLVLCQVLSIEGAQELRYGTLQWEQTSHDEVLLKIDAAWTSPSNDNTDLLTCLSCVDPLSPTTGDTLRLLLPHERARPGALSGIWFGDEEQTGLANGTQSNVTFTVEDTSHGLLLTTADVTHQYPAMHPRMQHVRTFHAALRGCCRGGELQNHIGYGWNVVTTIILLPAFPPAPAPPPRSPFFAWVPSTTVLLGSNASVTVLALDHVRSPHPEACAPAANWTGCRLRYQLASVAGVGYNLSVPAPDAVTPLDAAVTLDPHTGELQIPAAVTSGFASGDGLSIVMVVESQPLPSAPSAPAPRTTLDFVIHFKDAATPPPSPLELTAPFSSWLPGPPDVSTWPAMDFVCQSSSSYRLNASGPVSVATIPRRANLSAHGPPLLEFTSTEVGGGVGFEGVVSWSAPCSALGLHAFCLQACDPAADCSPPVCGRMDIRGDCLQGENVFLPPTPGTGGTSAMVSARVGEEVEVAVRGVGAALGQVNGIIMNNIGNGTGGDRRLALLGSPGLPNGAMSLGEVLEGADAVSMRVRWTPAQGQEGMLYSVCFRIYSVSKPELCPPVSHCVHLLVEAPRLSFQSVVPTSPLLPPSFLDNASSVAPDQVVHIAPGCFVTLRWRVQRGPYNAHLVPEPSVGIPPGAALAFASSTQASDGNFHDDWHLTWRPSRDFLQRRYPACLMLVDELADSTTGPAVQHPREKIRCVEFEMRRCEACAEAGQTLQHVAAHWFGADWLQIWGSNPEIVNPDSLPDNVLLRLGPVYHVKPGDTLSRIARRFGVAVTFLQRLNPEVGSGDVLHAGQPLCILPRVCPPEDLQ